MEDLRHKLAMVVKSIQWSYAIFWSHSSTEPGVLRWCDGYYNGDIKTRKTIQVEEMEDIDNDEMGLQRTAQLRQLYESLLSASEYNEPQKKTPFAALSPEDLTDTEWYFLVCMTFDFGNGQGLPGRTLAKNTTSWLCNAHFADSKVFSRSLLAKSASIQTVVCFPYLEGVLEFGITEKVFEEPNIIKQIKALIFDFPPQKPFEIPLESCSVSLDHDFIDKTREQSFQFADEEEEGEVSFYRNNSISSSDCISQNLASGPSDLLSDEDSRYQCVLSNIFKNTERLITGPRFRSCDFKESAFFTWKNHRGVERKRSCSQMLLKNALYKVPKMHENHAVRSVNENGVPDRIRKFKADDMKNIDHRFSVLSSLVSSKGKVDKVSLLDDTINYLKTLEKKVESLQSNKKSRCTQERTSDNYANKRKASYDLEELQEESAADCITVSATEKDVTIEIRCKWRDNMTLQVFEAMSSLNLEAYSVHSSIVDGILSLTIESKLKSGMASTAKMIRQALQRVICRH